MLSTNESDTYYAVPSITDFARNGKRKQSGFCRMVDAIALSAKVHLLFSVQPTRSIHLCRLPNLSASKHEVRSPNTSTQLSLSLFPTHWYTQNTFYGESSMRLNGLINLSDFIVFPGIRFNRIIHSSFSHSTE